MVYQYVIGVVLLMGCLFGSPAAAFCGTCLQPEPTVQEATLLLHELPGMATFIEDLSVEELRNRRKKLEAALECLCRGDSRKEVEGLLRRDAEAWQEHRFESACRSHNGVEIVSPMKMGLEAVAEACRKLRAACENESVPPELRSELESILQQFADAGMPDKLLPQTWQWEHVRPLQWFWHFLEAAAEPDEARALQMLCECSRSLHTLCQTRGLEPERMELLADIFAGYQRYFCSESWYAYENPIVPECRRTPARMKALEPFFSLLPPLRELVLNPAAYLCYWSRSAYTSREEELRCRAGDVCLAYEVVPGGGDDVRLLQYGVPVTEAEVQAEIMRYATLATGEYIRIIVDRVEDVEHPGVERLVHFCEEQGMGNILLSVRRHSLEGFEHCANPLPFTDVVCRQAHPSGKGWVEFRARRDAPPGPRNEWGFDNCIRIMTPAGHLLEYLAANQTRGVMRVLEPWSPDGQHLLLPVSLASGVIVVPVAALEKPDFSWASLAPISLGASVRYHSPYWKSARCISFIAVEDGIAFPMDYTLPQ